MSDQQQTDKQIAQQIYAHMRGKGGGNAYGLPKLPSTQQADIERLKAEVKALRAKLAALTGDE